MEMFVLSYVASSISPPSPSLRKPRSFAQDTSEVEWTLCLDLSGCVLALFFFFWVYFPFPFFTELDSPLALASLSPDPGSVRIFFAARVLRLDYSARFPSVQLAGRNSRTSCLFPRRSSPSRSHLRPLSRFIAPLCFGHFYRLL